MYTYKKWGCLISTVLLLAIVGNASAADIEWNNASGDRLWRNSANWAGGAVPGSADKACIRTSGVGPIIDSSTTAVVLQIVLSDWSSSGDYIDMTGGSLTTGDWFVIGYQPVNNGTFTISAGTVSVGGDFLVGNMGAGTLDMTGGSITVTGAFGIAQLGGSGDAFLDGGTISSGTFSMASGAAMDITAGTLIVNGDVTSTINGYISSGWITAYGGSGTVNVDYNVTNPGKTTVTASEPTIASNPSPADGAAGVNINANLSWTAGIYATSHDVYFGTDSTPDATEFQGNQPGTTFDPGTMAINTIYYWRIDEVNPAYPESPWIGDVWSFSTYTVTANFRKGPYLVYRGDNTQMQVLWQLDASAPSTIEWGTDTTYSDGSANTSQYGENQHSYTIGSLTPLTPGTMYYYRVTVGTNQSTGNFTTAPAASATNVKFLMYGDTRTNPNLHDDVAAGMISVYNADPLYQTMTLHAGDWVNTNSESDWTNEWFNYSYGNLMENFRRIPIQGCRGNHEGGGSVWEKYYPFPYVGGFYWSFDYGPVHVSIVDQYVDYSPGSGQYNWLVNDLSNSTKTWKIIVLHQPGWSCAAGHGDDGNVKTRIHPLCMQYGVQIVLAGHNHYFARAVVDDVHHITSGAGGADAGQNPVLRDPVVVCAGGLSFQKVEISSNTLTCTTTRPDGTVLDTFEISYGPPPLPGQATNPSPADGAIDVSAVADLSWTAGTDTDSHDVYFGTDSTPDSSEFQGNQTATTFDPGTMAASTTYYWRIDEVNTAGTTTGVVWSFTTEAPPPLPGQATNPSPADGATGVSTNADLSWTAGSGADSHDVYFGTDSTPDSTEFQGNQTATTFDPGTMATNTTYYWRIDEVNVSGTTTGVVWSFTTSDLSDTTDDGTGTISANGDNPPDETMDKAFDNLTSTKWLDFSPSYSWIQYQYADSKTSVVTEYTLTSANDSPERDPMDWNILGSNTGGASWDTLDTRTGELFTARFQTRSFQFANSTAYNIYRLEITQVRDGATANSVQLAEIELIGTTPAPPGPPDQATNPSPADGATDVSITATLSWTAGSGATSHDVYFGTTSPGTFQGNQTATTFDPGTMAESTTYYWRIDEVNASGTTTGVVWSFTTVAPPPPPGQATNPSPADGATDVSITATLSWTAGSGATSHDVYFGTTSPGTFQGNQTATTFDPGTMANSTTYYWRIDEVNASGTTTGVVWSFTTEAVSPPGQATNPSPADGATDVSINADLSWTAGSGATSHDVYFGTTSPGTFQGNQTATTFDPGTMAYSTTYYWRIDEVNAGGTTTGVVWSFTTEAEACVASTTHVESIVCGTVRGDKGKKYGQVTVTIYDNCGAPVGNADVTGTFTGDFNEQLTETTNGSGVAVITTTTQVKKPSYQFCVDSVTHATLTYAPGDNVETCDSY